MLGARLRRCTCSLFFFFVVAFFFFFFRLVVLHTSRVLSLSLCSSPPNKHAENLAETTHEKRRKRSKRAQQHHTPRQRGGGIREQTGCSFFFSPASKKGLASTTSLPIIMPEGDGTSRGSPEMAPPSDQYPPSSSSMVPQRAPPVSFVVGCVD